MRLFTLDDQVQICDCMFNQLLRELFVSHIILYFGCRCSEDELSKFNIYSVMNSNGTCFEQNGTSRSNTSNFMP